MVKEEKFGLDIKKKKAFPVRTVRRGTGFPDRLCCLHPWRFSRLNWIKPRATQSDLIGDPGLSRRLDKRPPEVPPSPNYPMI